MAINSKSIISKLQTQDVGRWIHLSSKKRKLQNKQKKQGSPEVNGSTANDGGKGLTGLSAELEELELRSTAKTKNIEASIPAITLPAELPIAALEEEFIDAIQHNQVVIVAGETGCGKTTQLPKLCLKAGLGCRGLIGHTQPRRVAATSVARRIAEELSTPLGQLVGYSVRFQQKTSDNTRILLMTDGVLLSEMENDPWLSRYEVIIIDEAHERSLNIDFLLGFLKGLLLKRSDLRVVITSATIDPERFSQFFNQAPMMTVSGRSYPVEIRYRPLINDDAKQIQDETSAVLSAVEECIDTAPGDILIFANGEGEIKNLCRQIHNLYRNQLQVLPLYARLGIAAQNKVFAPSTKRKVVVSTNVAETSLTVPGIVFVIDIGTARISRFSQRTKIQQLPVEKISQASAAQRAGRCGRVAAGVCIRLYDEEDFEQREAFTSPEIQRTNLASVVLRLKMMGVKSLHKFPLMQHPSDQAWKSAVQQLTELGALNGQQQLTKLGKLMARIPADPQLARLVVENKHHALHEMMIIAAFMSGREIRERPMEAQQKADQAHREFQVKGSDSLTVINLWQQMAEQRQSMSSNQFRQWCQQNYLNFLGWLEWKNLYQQLKQSVYSIGLVENKSPASAEQIHRSLIPGFVSHLMLKDKDGAYKGCKGMTVWLHPSSVCFKSGSKWMLSLEIMETSKAWARMNSPLEAEWIEQACVHLLKDRYYDPHWRKERGQACQYLDRNLFGLPLVVKRVVSCVDTESEISRQLFLKDGLATDQLKSKIPFVKDNIARLNEILELEHAQRTQGFAISEEQLASLYQEKLPPTIRTEKALIRWLKKDWKQRNLSLLLSREQLLAKPLQDDNGFPSEITVKGYQLKLKYRFAPGEEDDGVTVCIPAAMANQFSDNDFEWLVPGLLEEKILLTLRGLDKSIRKKLIPLAGAAQTIFQRLMEQDYAKENYLNTIAYEVKRLLGFPVGVDDFSAPDWPAHLKMKFQIIEAGKQGKGRGKPKFSSIATFSSIAELSESVSAKMGSAGESHSGQLSTGLKGLQWPADGIVLETSQQQQKQKIRLFRALSFDNNQFYVRTCRSLTEAKIIHHFALAQIQRVRLKTAIHKFYKSWPEKRTLDRLTIRMQGGIRFIETLFERLVHHSLDSESLPQTKLAFEQFSQQIENEWRRQLTELLETVMPILELRESINLKLSSLGHQVYQQSKSDIEKQLNMLWQPQRLVSKYCNLESDYIRLHKAIDSRITRIHQNFPKEQMAIENWLAWAEWWSELAEGKAAAWMWLDQVQQLFWQLEEFRVSLFSPAVKAKAGVSSKKLQKLFEQIESESLL